MSEKITRRDFLKLAGAGAAASAVLTGCGPASRYVVREPYVKMPEYTLNGQSTYYATTCRECSAGCGLVVRTMQGRAIKNEGNKIQPVSLGKTCARGQLSLQGLYNPDLVTYPLKTAQRGVEVPSSLDAKSAVEYWQQMEWAQGSARMEWDQAIAVVADALQSTDPSALAFLVGLAPDHLYDLVVQLTQALGAPAPLRYGALGMFEARSTLVDATEKVFGTRGLPNFDVANADLTFSFGSNFLETWVSPVAYTRQFATMRRGHPERRGYMVQFEPRLSQTALNADEWIPILPGSEGLVALAIGRLAAEHRGGQVPPAFAEIAVSQVSRLAGVEVEVLERLAQAFAVAENPIAVPGGSALGHQQGLENAQAILSLNATAGNIGAPGGVYLVPSAGVGQEEYAPPATPRQMYDFANTLASGEVKALFVHGVNPLFELPASFGLKEALSQVPLIISFASFPDETALQSDYVFPDHTPHESWGYQRIWAGADRATLAGGQPVVSPFRDTRATADVLLAAARAVGGAVAAALPYADEVAFIQSQILGLMERDGFYNAATPEAFWAQWQQYGGWWAAQPGLEATLQPGLDQSINVTPPSYHGEGEFVLLPYPSPVLGDGAGANRPWLQEAPDPTTTVMWNSWVEINPATAEELGLQNEDVVVISNEFGAIEASVYRYPAIHPRAIGFPFGQGHTALGRYARGRGANPTVLTGPVFNASGDLAFSGMRVSISKTGRQRVLARLESLIGVYGDGLPEGFPPPQP
jgi:anaerobic selenocysteine-containing dehydrogenase